MTDKTERDALVALADELAAAWNTAKEFDMDEFADRIRALAVQPAESGQRCSLGVGCDEAGVCYARANGQPEQCGRTAAPAGAAGVDTPIGVVRTDGCMHYAYIPHHIPDGTAVYLATPAASVDVEGLRELVAELRHESESDDQSSEYECGEHSARAEVANRLASLIDSAGGAKVDPWATLVALADALDIDTVEARKAPGKPSDVYLEAARRKFATPQPAEGDGAVACPRCGAPCTTTEEGCVDPMLGDTRYTAYHYTRPSAASAVPDDEANQSPEQLAQWLDAKYARHHEDEDRQAAAMLRKLAALAQQEPRHE